MGGWVCFGGLRIGVARGRSLNRSLNGMVDILCSKGDGETVAVIHTLMVGYKVTSVAGRSIHRFYSFDWTNHKPKVYRYPIRCCCCCCCCCPPRFSIFFFCRLLPPSPLAPPSSCPPPPAPADGPIPKPCRIPVKVVYASQAE